MTAAGGTITRRLDAVLDGLEEEFCSLYDVSDFEEKLRALRQASKSERPSRLKELFELFAACGISYERDRDDAYYEKLVRSAELPDPSGTVKIPDFSGIEDRMVYALYTRYREYPAPQDYMKRIVDRYNDTHEDKLPSITPHVLRHTFCTEMANSGIDLKSLQYLMGHSDVGVTLNVYTHASYERAESAMRNAVGNG